MSSRILVVDDEESIRMTFESFLTDEGHTVVTVEDRAEALAKMDEDTFDLVFVDITLRDGSGLDVLREVRSRKLRCQVIIITGFPDVETATEAVRLGVFDYLIKPVRHQNLVRVTGMALRHKALDDEKEEYRANLEAVFRSVQDAIISVDKGLLVVQLNDAAMRMCGFSHEVIGLRFDTVLDGCNGRCVELLNESMKRKEPIEAHRVECKRGSRPRSLINITTYPLLDYKGAFSGVVMVSKDETRLADLEVALEERQRCHRMVGKSTGMQKVYSLVDALADVHTTVLITGESGTGKELVAEALHYGGGRRHKPLVKVNCSALPETLLESELFGHVKGAFTGAVHDKIGRFQMAQGGTIFLDEIGDLSPRIQLQLLRVLQEKEFERVGDPVPVKLDLRIVTATNRFLLDRIKSGEFREDLYYRLKVVEVALPPMRERREDIPLLIEHFLSKFNKIFNKKIVAVSRDVQGMLVRHSWPGNVRELEHVLEHAFVLCRGSVITLEQLPADFVEGVKASNGSGSACDRSMEECQPIIDALVKTGWNKARAARILGIDRKTLYRWLEKHNLGQEPVRV